MDDFHQKVAEFLKAAEDIISESDVPNRKLSTQTMKRYVKVIDTFSNEQQSCWAFIDFKGDIFKSETWNRPAKHARGNIYSEQRGVEALDTKYGAIKYLRGM